MNDKELIELCKKFHVHLSHIVAHKRVKYSKTELKKMLNNKGWYKLHIALQKSLK